MANLIIPKPGSTYNESFALGSDDKPYQLLNGKWVPINTESAIEAIDCSTNPLCPIAIKNQKFRVSNAGHFGSINGPEVEVNDLIICISDNDVEGTWDEKGANFFILQADIQPKNLEKFIQKTYIKHPYDNIDANNKGNYSESSQIKNEKEIIKISHSLMVGSGVILPPLANSECSENIGLVRKIIVINKSANAITLYAYNNMINIDTINGSASVSIPAGKYIELIGYSVTETSGAWETLRTDII